MQELVVPGVPGPFGHYSHAVIHDGVVYMSGILPGTVPVTASVAEQANALIDGAEKILAAAGSSLSLVLSVRMYVCSMDDWPAVNAVYAERFGSHRPARIVVAVPEIHHGYRLQLELTAAQEGSEGVAAF